MHTPTKKSQKQAGIEEARVALLKILKPSMEVYATIKKVSSTGMSRQIAILVIDGKQIRNISGWVATFLGMKWNDNGSVTVGGCGMDMGFHVVYTLSRALWPDGFPCAGEPCRSNDHTNGDEDRKPHQHGDGGYALIHRSP